MNPLAVVIDIVLILISIVLIVAVLMQQGQRQGLGAIGGGAETFFGKNKSKGYEAKMAKITKIGATVFIVLAIVATIITARSLNQASVPLPLGEDGTYTAEQLEHDHDGDGIPDHDVDVADVEEPEVEVPAEAPADGDAEPVG